MKKDKVFIAALCLISIGVVFLPRMRIQDFTAVTSGLSPLISGNEYNGLYAIKDKKAPSTPIKTSRFLISKKQAAIKTKGTSLYNSASPISEEQVTTEETGSVHWILYGKEKWNLTSSPVSEHQEFSVENQRLLDTVPKDFQASLLSAIPLDCHPGPEGVFKQKYSKFLNVLAEYTLEHSKMKNDPSSKTLIWQCGEECGGLSDRLRGITFSLFLAIFSHRRLIIYQHSEQEVKYLHPNMIDWKDEAAYQYLKSNEKKKSIETPASKITKVSGQNFEAVRSNKTNVILMIRAPPHLLLTYSQKWIKLALEQNGLSDLSVNEINSLVGLAFRYLFKLDDIVLNEVHLARNVLGLTHPYTALHVRSGFIGMSNQEHPSYKHMRTASEWKASYQKAVSVADTILGKDSLVFLSSDSSKVKELAMESYPQRFRTLDNQILHYNEVAASNTAKVKIEEGNLLIWVELLLMAQANTLVKGRSGYSLISGWLCGLDQNTTVITV